MLLSVLPFAGLASSFSSENSTSTIWSLLLSFMFISLYSVWGGLSFLSLGFWSCIMVFWVWPMILLSKKDVNPSFNFNYVKSLSVGHFSLWLLSVTLVLFFCWDFLYFYTCFEITLIPMGAILLVFGHQMERLQAYFYLNIYTIFFSYPLLFCISLLGNEAGSFSFLMVSLFSKSFSESFILIIFLLGFFVKLPIYGLHMWLPKAHVEAPLVGSIILAALLLKMGAWGLFVMSLLSSGEIMSYLSMFTVMSIILFGGGLSALSAMYQEDTKSTIAFSSISHMAMVCTGILLFSMNTTLFSVILYLSHALSSPLMFFICYLFLEMKNSRLWGWGGNILNASTKLSLLLVLASCFNFSAPPFFSILGEMGMGGALFCTSGLWGAFFVLVVIGVSSFSIYLSSSQVFLEGSSTTVSMPVSSYMSYFFMVVLSMLPGVILIGWGQWIIL